MVTAKQKNPTAKHVKPHGKKEESDCKIKCLKKKIGIQLTVFHKTLITLIYLPNRFIMKLSLKLFCMFLYILSIHYKSLTNYKILLIFN